MTNKKKIIDTINIDFGKKKILVLGDLMVDEYITGSVKRISPEAPVPILNYQNKRTTLGGAANVAKNLRSLGSRVAVSGVASEDRAGKWLKQRLGELDIESNGIVDENGRPTTLKKRYATMSQQLIRIDSEVTDCIKDETQSAILEYISKNAGEIDGLLISDYTKGVLKNGAFIQKIIQVCNQNKILVAIDSKSRDISYFENADFIKPNNLELENAIGIKITDDESLNKAGTLYLSKSKAKCLVVTRGENGISVFKPGKDRLDFPSKAVEVYDVTGAGDTVISVIMLASVCGIEISDAVVLANLAANVVISKVGTVCITKQELLEKLNAE